MQTHGGQAAAQAIEAGEREFAHRLMVDWDRDGQYAHPLSDLSEFVTRTSRDGSISSTAPDEAMLVEGYSAAKLDVELAGEFRGEPLAHQFSPYNGRSTFYAQGIPVGARCYYDIGVVTAEGTVWYRQITGIVRKPAIDRGSGRVTLTCLDNVETARGSVDIPPYGLWQNYLQIGARESLLIDSCSLIDMAARVDGFTMGPQRFPSWPDSWPDSGMIFSAPLHGSILPEIGTLDNFQTFHLTEQWRNSSNTSEQERAEQWRDGPHGYPALNAVPNTTAGYERRQNGFWCDDSRGVADGLNGTWVLGAWMYWPGPNVDRNSWLARIRIRGNRIMLQVLADGVVRPRIEEHSGGPVTTGPQVLLPDEPGWHYVEVGFAAVNSSPHSSVWMRTRIDDTVTSTVQVLDYYPGSVNDPLSGVVTIENIYAVSDVTIFQSDYFGYAPGDQLTADDLFLSDVTHDLTPLDTALVSWGRNRVQWTTREHGREAWKLAKEVAGAEFGVVLFDEHGRFVFWNYDDVAGRAQTSVRTFTLDTLGSLGMQATLDGVRNVWTVTTRPGRSLSGIAYDLGQDGVPHHYVGTELIAAQFIIQPSNWGTYRVAVDDHVISVEPYTLPNRTGVEWGEHGPLQGCIAWTTGGSTVSFHPTTEQKMLTRDEFRLAVWNPNGDPIQFVGPDDQPRYRVQGTIVVEGEERVWTLRDEASVAAYGERVIEHGGPWVQDETATRALLADLAAKMAEPIPTTDTITVPGDPRVQLGDTIEVRDVAGFGDSMLMQIYGIRREATTDAGITDTYTVEMVRQPRTWVLGSPTRSVLGHSTVLS